MIKIRNSRIHKNYRHKLQCCDIKTRWQSVASSTSS